MVKKNFVLGFVALTGLNAAVVSAGFWARAAVTAPPPAAANTKVEPETQGVESFEVKNVHCAACVQTIKSVICPDRATCEVKQTDSKKQLGRIRVSPKPNETKVNTAELKKTLELYGYDLQTANPDPR